MISISHQGLDLSIVLFFNQYCGKSLFTDTLSLVFLSVDALRTAILVALVIGIWEFGRYKNDINANKRVIAILLSIIISLGVIEILNAVINSQRPIVTYENQINRPLLTSDTKPLWQDGWTRNPKHGSFPSDTVALISTIAFGIFLWKRTLGIFAMIFVLLTGILPRLYFGLHYPSDMLTGVFIAIISTFVTEKIKFFEGLTTKILNIQKRFPYGFGVIGFYLAYIIADKFILLRKLPLWIKAMFSDIN